MYLKLSSISLFVYSLAKLSLDSGTGKVNTGMEVW